MKSAAATPASKVGLESPIRQMSPLKSVDVVDIGATNGKHSNGERVLPAARPYDMERVDRPYAVDASEQPMKPLTIEASPPLSPSSGAVPDTVMSVTSPSQSSSHMAKERMLSALGHHKLW